MTLGEFLFGIGHLTIVLRVGREASAMQSGGVNILMKA
jgi:hypothetical protein